MTGKIQNAKQLPKLYYGLHMVEGVAEYRPKDKEPYRIFLNNDTLKKMDKTYSGRPLYVLHVDEVSVDNIQNEADGYVIRSFYNKADGKHWAEFLVVSDKGHDAIKKGWKLSNAYIPKTFANGGQWHGVDFQKEITDGEYEHLAIVPDPRYAESLVLTPEEFKEYNFKKETELQRLTNSNSNGGKKMSLIDKMRNFLNDAEAEEAKKKEAPMANGEHMVEVGKDKMTVNELVAKHMQMCDDAKKNADAEEAKKKEADAKKNDELSDEEAKKKALELAKHEEEEIAKKKNEDEAAKKAADEKKKNEDEAAAKKKAEDEEIAKKKNSFDDLANAHLTQPTTPSVDLSSDKLARGVNKYGSGR